MTETKKCLLEINDLTVEFHTDEGVLRAVDGVSLSVNSAETVALVGESGCGKSVTALSIMRLIAKPQGRITKGSVCFKGEDLTAFSEVNMRKLRGNKISMIFQEPMTSLNPVFTVGDQIMEVFRLHQALNKGEALSKSIEMLKLVGIPSAEERVFSYPHELSGGMRQRVMIAMALACKPDLLIADEPTTALDVTIQAQIMDLMKKLQKELGMGIILITHDLGVVAEMCDRAYVMYAGQIVEEANIYDIFDSPRHPYTVGLLNSIPGLKMDAAAKTKNSEERLKAIPGMVPNLLDIKVGCRFADRCFKAQSICSRDNIGLSYEDKKRTYRCLFPQK